MRICIVRANKNAYSETFLRNQIVGLSQFAEVYPVYGGWMPDRAEDGKFFLPYPIWLMQKVVEKLTGKRSNLISRFGLKRYLEKKNIDVVLVNYGIAAACVFPVCQKINVPFVAHFHGFDATHRETILRYGKKYKIMFRHAASLVAVSNDMKLALCKLGAVPEKVHVIPCAVDVNLFRSCNPAQNPPLLISVGRFTKKKSQDLIVRSFKGVHDKFPSARLAFVGGDDGLLDKCVALVKDFALEESVSFKGVLDSRSIIQMLREARAYVQHSIVAPDGDSEGTPVSVLEASASGLPIVATRHAGIKEAVIHGETGFLVEEGDYLKMTEYVLILLDRPELAKEMGQKGRRHIERNYNLPIQSKKLFRILEAAVSL